MREALGITADGNIANYRGEHDVLLLDVLTTIKNKGVGPIYSKESRINLVEEAAQRIEPDGPKQPRLVFSENESEEKAEPIDNEPEGLLPGNSSDGGTAMPTSGEIDSDSELAVQMETGLPATSQEQASVVSHSPMSTDDIRPMAEMANVAKRRKPVNRDDDKRMFGHTLRPKGIASNNIYRGIDWVDAQYLKDRDSLGHLLPILGFSLRLLIETVAREYYASIGDERGDSALSPFLKEVAKPAIKAKLDPEGRNNLALASEWIDGKHNFEALLGKWAHGTLAVDRAALVRQSELVALIIDEVWT